MNRRRLAFVVGLLGCTAEVLRRRLAGVSLLAAEPGLRRSPEAGLRRSAILRLAAEPGLRRRSPEARLRRLMHRRAIIKG